MKRTKDKRQIGSNPWADSGSAKTSSKFNYRKIEIKISMSFSSRVIMCGWHHQVTQCTFNEEGLYFPPSIIVLMSFFSADAGRKRQQEIRSKGVTHVDSVVDVLLVAVEDVQTNGEGLDATLSPTVARCWSRFLWFLGFFFLLLLLLFFLGLFLVSFISLFSFLLWNKTLEMSN